MLGLCAALLFAGYTLVYAAVANGGRFAASPWEALRTDAYTGGPAGAPSSGGTAPARHGGSGGIVGALNTILQYVPLLP